MTWLTRGKLSRWHCCELLSDLAFSCSSASTTLRAKHLRWSSCSSNSTTLRANHLRWFSCSSNSTTLRANHLRWRCSLGSASHTSLRKIHYISIILSFSANWQGWHLQLKHLCLYSITIPQINLIFQIFLTSNSIIIWMQV